MSIISSEITEDREQHDGRRHVSEKHIDDEGKEYTRSYLAAAGENVIRLMDNYVPDLEEELLFIATENAAFATRDREQAIALDGLTDDILKKVLVIDDDELVRTRDDLTRRSA